MIKAALDLPEIKTEMFLLGVDVSFNGKFPPHYSFKIEKKKSQ